MVARMLQAIAAEKPCCTMVTSTRKTDKHILQESPHNHEDDELFAKHDKILDTLRENIRQDPSVTLKRVYENISRRHAQGCGDREPMPEFHRVKSTMSRTRLEYVPAVPRYIEDVTIRGQWENTWSNEKFAMFNDNDLGILIYATDENLEIFRQCSEIYCDWAFHTCSRPYEQYFTIHGKYRNRVLCLDNCLMVSRNIADYRNIFQTLNTQIRELTGHRWRPRGVICDFEQVLIAALETKLCNAQVG